MVAHSRFKVLLILITALFFWAGNTVIGKYATPYIGPISLSFYRWLVASIILLVFAAKPLFKARHLLREHWLALVILGVIGTGMYNTLLYLGLTYTSAINSGIVLATLPMMIIGLNFLLGYERINRLQLTGLFVSVTGVIWVIIEGDTDKLLNFDFNLGDILVLIAVASWALYSVLLRKLRPVDLGTLPFLAVQFLVGLLFILPFYLLELSRGSPTDWQVETYSILLYVGIFPSIIAYYLWQQGIAMGGANMAGLISPLISILTASIAYVVLGETLKQPQLLGALLVISGVFISVVASHSKRT